MRQIISDYKHFDGLMLLRPLGHSLPLGYRIESSEKSQKEREQSEDAFRRKCLEPTGNDVK